MSLVTLYYKICDEQKHAQTHRENSIKISQKLVTSSKLFMFVHLQGMEDICIVVAKRPPTQKHLCWCDSRVRLLDSVAFWKVSFLLYIDGGSSSCRKVSDMVLTEGAVVFSMFVLIRTVIVTRDWRARLNRNCLRGGHHSGTQRCLNMHLYFQFLFIMDLHSHTLFARTISNSCHVAATREAAAVGAGWRQEGTGVAARSRSRDL